MCGLGTFARRVDNHINAIVNLVCNLLKGEWCGITRDVGRGRYKGATQTADYTLAEVALGNTDAHGALLGNKILGYAATTRKYQREGFVGNLE